MVPDRAARFLVEVGGGWRPYRGGEIPTSTIRADVGPPEGFDSHPGDLEMPQDGIASPAMRFFEARRDKTPVAALPPPLSD